MTPISSHEEIGLEYELHTRRSLNQMKKELIYINLEIEFN